MKTYIKIHSLTDIYDVFCSINPEGDAGYSWEEINKLASEVMPRFKDVAPDKSEFRHLIERYFYSLKNTHEAI